MKYVWVMIFVFGLFGQQPGAGPQIQGPMPARDGETCVVCYGRCDQADVAYIVDGQRVAVMKPLEKAFLDDPEQYLRLYRPNSIQFQGVPAQGISDRYLLVGLFALLAITLAGFYAHHRVVRRVPRSVLPRGLAKIPATKQPVPCPLCGGENHPSAKSCSHCGATATPSERSEVDAI